jgi:very-short-patch-repair endonuclease
MSIVQNIHNRNERNKLISATENDLHVDIQQTLESIVLERNSPPMEGCPKGGVAQSPNSKKHPKPKEVLTTINGTKIYRNFIQNLPRSSRLNQLSKDKRKAGILPEVLFWKQVHKGYFHKIDFDRQRIIGNYIVDFYVKALGLVVEIDGSSHDYKQAYDAARQAYLESFGLKFFRCTNFEVKNNINAVFTALEDFIVNEYGENSSSVFDYSNTEGELAPFLYFKFLNIIKK